MNITPQLNCIQRFEQAIIKFENRPCIEDGDRTVSFGEFYGLVKQVANYIIASGKGKKIIIDMPQGIDAYASIVATLSVGGSWCPIPQHIPSARRATIIREFQPDLIIQEPIKESFGNHAILPEDLSENSLAYVLFTSGSTGGPKGVMVNRGTIDTFLEWSLTTYKTSETDRWGQFCRLNFDLSVIDLFTSLCSGACLVVLNDMLSQIRPLDSIHKHRLTVWHSVPSLVDYMMENDTVHPVDISSLNIASFCGEPLKKYQLDFLFEKNKNLRVINSYGTTEGGLNATWIELNAANYTNYIENHVSIGRAIPDWGVHLEQDGELVIYGEHIGAGYLNATNEQFRKITVAERIYPAFYTGDLAYEKNGLLYFIGRKDHQVKLRGNRIELSEIEYWITELCGKPCVTILHNENLYSFVESKEELDVIGLRKKLMKHLEKVKIPNLIISIAVFPRNSNFKIVRNELAALIPTAKS